MRSDRAKGLRGTIVVPGDKSVAHRAVILGALASGETVIRNFPGGADNQSTLALFGKLGVKASRPELGEVRISGRGAQGLAAPPGLLDAGNSGTTARLVSGVLAAQSFKSILTGDSSLRQRPMARITTPLRRMGANIEARPGERLPLTINGGVLKGMDYEMEVASAQVKSCLLLAGIYARGTTRLKERAVTRDHTERMFKLFGIPIERDGDWLEVRHSDLPEGCEVRIPGDLSSAAFLIGAALVLPDSEITIRDVGINPTRSGILELWKRMGADIKIEEERLQTGEPVATLTARSSELRAIEVDGEDVVRAIDEIPILAVTAAHAEGVTVIRGASELRVKESDRITALSQGLSKLGAKVEEFDDGLAIEGPSLLRGAELSCHGDHRIAMALYIAALTARGESSLDQEQIASISFPGFYEMLESLLDR